MTTKKTSDKTTDQESSRYYTTREVMALLRYSDKSRQAFWQMIRRQVDGPPLVRIGKRLFIFPAVPFDAWLSSRTSNAANLNQRTSIK